MPGRGNGWAYILQSLRDRDGIWWPGAAGKFALVGITSENVLDAVVSNKNTEDRRDTDRVLNLWLDS